MGSKKKKTAKKYKELVSLARTSLRLDRYLRKVNLSACVNIKPRTVDHFSAVATRLEKVVMLLFPLGP